MEETSLKDLIDWANHVDQGVSRLEHLVGRPCMLDNEFDPKEVQQKFEDIIADVKETKALVQKDVDILKKMSEESKAVIAMTETNDFRSIEDELTIMLTTLFPEDAAVAVEQPVPSVDIESENLPQDDIFLPEYCAENVSPIFNNHVPEESYTEVEITPGLVSKIPKSQFGSEAQHDTDDAIASRRFPAHAYRPIRKKTLVFTPSDSARKPQAPISGSASASDTPLSILQDRSNCARGRAAAGSHFSQPIDECSPEILQRPTRPILSSMQYGTEF